MTNNKGFTLIETVIVVVVLGLLLTGVYAIFNSGIELFSIEQTQVANQASIRTLLTSIEKKIRKFDSDRLISKDASNCLVIPQKFPSTLDDKYCLVNKTIEFNKNPIIDRVLEFKPEVKEEIDPITKDIIMYTVNISVKSSPDSKGRNISYDVIFKVRVKGR